MILRKRKSLLTVVVAVERKKCTYETQCMRYLVRYDVISSNWIVAGQVITGNAARTQIQRADIRSPITRINL